MQSSVHLIQKDAISVILIATIELSFFKQNDAYTFNKVLASNFHDPINTTSGINEPNDSVRFNNNIFSKDPNTQYDHEAIEAIVRAIGMCFFLIFVL